MILLYRKNANSIGTWRIWSEDSVIHIAHATVMGGSEVFHKEVVSDGKQSRSLFEQVQSRISSRVSRMLDKGYKRDIDSATNSSSNQLGFVRPMLAQPLQNVGAFKAEGAVQQKKLNGHRCLITKQDGELVAYSRQGKPITSIKHILEALGPHVPEGVTIDGELYRHGVRLQTLASWIKREQANTYLLSYVVYDIISDDEYIDRHAELSDICSGAVTVHSELSKSLIGEMKLGAVMVLPYEPYTSISAVTKRRDEVIAAGFEGMMVRLPKKPYEAGKRSASLIKVKKFIDAEFKVIRIEPSADNWAICVCLTAEGREFKVSAPGSMAEKKKVLDNQSDYLDTLLTVEYAELTEDGIPFHCSAISWRVDV
jgi:DNA ligase-1